MLVSIVLVSNRPDNLRELFRNIEDTVDDPGQVEVVVKIDEGDEPTIRCLREETAARRFRIVTLIGPPPASHFHLWSSLNDLHRLVDADAYFVCNLNDEVRFLSKGWDSVLQKHVGLFPDHIFRLRTSRWKLRTYTDLWECWYAPENYGFHTKRWIDIQGGWNACHVSDSFQQCVAYYLALGTYPNPDQCFRDVPIWGIEMGGQEAAEGLDEARLQARNLGNDRAWYRIMSPEMQTEIFRRARLLQMHIWLAEHGIAPVSLRDDPRGRLLSAHGPDGAPIIAFSYQVPEWRIRLETVVERLKGGGFHHHHRLARVNDVRFFRGAARRIDRARLFHTTRFPTPWAERVARWRRMLEPAEWRFGREPDDAGTPHAQGAPPPSRPLISFHLASKFPSKLDALFDNIELTAEDPSRIEVFVKIDEEDTETAAYLRQAVPRRSFALRYIVTPRGEGYFDLWKGYNEIIRLCAPDARFVSLINDELYFRTMGWDRILERYADLFPDGIFRLRVSAYKLRNYSDYWECGFAPDAYAIYTKRWFDVSGDWNACNTPDAFQQTVAFRLWEAAAKRPDAAFFSRDVPVWDIELGGEEPYRGLGPSELAARVRRARKDWRILTSPAIQQEASHRAHRLLNHMVAARDGIEGFSVVSDRRRRQVRVVDAAGTVRHRTRYALDPLRIRLTNLLRAPFFDYYCGGNLSVLAFIHEHARRRVEQELSTAAGWRERLRIRVRHHATAALRGLFLEWHRRTGRYSPDDTPPLPGHSGSAVSSDFDGILGERKREAHSRAVASNWADKAPPSHLIDGTLEPWGSQETMEDTFVFLVRPKPVKIRAVEIVLFSPGGRAHLSDVSVIGGVCDGGNGLRAWRVLPARIGNAGAYGERLTIPPGEDTQVVRLEIDYTLPELPTFDSYGLACFSASRGDRRNHLPEGYGIYIRAMSLSTG